MSSLSTKFIGIDRKTNILHGGPDPENYDDGCSSLGQLYIKRLTQYGNKVLLIDGLTGEEVNGEQLRDRSIQMAQNLMAFGVRAGDSVGLCTLNRMEFAYVLIGTFLCGATVSPLNVTYTTAEIQHTIGFSKPKIIFTSPRYRERFDQILRANSFVKTIISFGDEFEQFKQQFKCDVTKGFECEAQQVDDNIALVLCSSGTTGLPKGVQLTQRNVMISMEQQAKRPSSHLEREYAPVQIILSITPWFHAFGLFSFVCYSLNGEKIVFLPKFEEEVFLQTIEKYKVNVLHMVPPLMVFLAKSHLIDNYDLSSLKIIWCGAAPLSKELEEAVQARLNIPVIRQGYGMTEGTLAFTSQTDDHHTSGSVGTCRAGLLCRIVDEITGENLPAFQQGELWIKGTVLMKGYANDKEATAKTIDADGWLHTGDIGYYSNDGELFIVDRLKELIKFKGFQVPPAEIEGMLLQHPKIADAAVIGKPNEEAGELPLAFVVKQPNVELTEQDVITFVADRVSHAKRLHGGVIFMDIIPKSPSGKILRRELRSLLSKIPSKL